MTLGAGTRLGPYEILSPLGAGGTAEVQSGADNTLLAQAAASRRTLISRKNCSSWFQLGTVGATNYLRVAVLSRFPTRPSQGGFL